MKKIAGFILIVILLITGCSSQLKATKSKEWVPLQTLEIWHSVYYAGFYNESIGITVGYHGATYYTEDGGKAWTKGDNEANCRYGLDFLDEKNLWTIGNYGGNRVSNDGGATLSAVTDFELIDNKPNQLLSIITKDTVWIASPVNLGVTHDGGLTWEKISFPNGCVTIVGMAFFSELEGYLLSEEGILYKTVDAGVSWSEFSRLVPATGFKKTETPSVAIHQYNKDELVVVFLDKDNYNYSALTSNGGETWSYNKIIDLMRASPYISNDGSYLTTINVKGELKLYKWE